MSANRYQKVDRSLRPWQRLLDAMERDLAYYERIRAGMHPDTYQKTMEEACRIHGCPSWSGLLRVWKSYSKTVTRF